MTETIFEKETTLINMEGAGFTTYTAASHQVLGFYMLSVFTCSL